MKLKLYFNLILITLTCIKLWAQDGADYCSHSKIQAFSRLNKLSQVQYPGDSNIDVTYYKLNLNVSYNPNYISGVVTIKARPAISQINSFFLDLVNQLQVTSVKLNGNNLSFSQVNDQLMITLNPAYSMGEEFSVDVAYQGVPGTRGSGSFEFQTHSGQPVIWSLSEPYGAKDWWPSKDTPADKADSSDVWITASNIFVSVSNGKLMEEIDNGNGTKTYKWKNSYPISGYLISVALSNYLIYETPFEYAPEKYFPVTHYVYPESFSSGKANIDLTPTMLRIFSEKFGDYPYLKEKYGHAQCGFSGGMEHQTVTSIGGYWEYIIAHELAHQWFGDKVTCKDWENIWLNEGFASYSECIYWEAIYGKAAFNNYVNNFMNSAKNARGTIYVQNITSESEIFNSARSYKKGAIVLHMLRGIVGDNIFFQILREYLNEPGLSYNVATTEDFQRIAEWT